MTSEVTENDRKFMADARAFAENHSKDRSTKVGALILGPGNEPLSFGWNGFPRKVNDDLEERHQRPLKYSFTCHAETNAITNAARSGIRLLGSRIYVTSLIPCADCTKNIIQSGISKVYLEKAAFDESNERVKAWIDQWPISKTMLDEAGIEVSIIGG
jgi:dCMP deaminase